MLRIPRSSVEPVSAPVQGPVALAGLDVHMAILPIGQDPADDDWKDATWNGDGDAQVLIGPSTALDLDKGTYMIWVRVTSTPPVKPVMESGKLQIT